VEGAACAVQLVYEDLLAGRRLSAVLVPEVEMVTPKLNLGLRYRPKVEMIYRLNCLLLIRGCSLFLLPLSMLFAVACGLIVEVVLPKGIMMPAHYLLVLYALLLVYHATNDPCPVLE
jgi:hypothetical protein